jgi:hypothetical protein
MTLRRQVSLILPFGQPVSLDPARQDFRSLALRRRLLAVLLLSAVWRSWSRGSRGFRSTTLRRRVFPVLLFIGAILLSRSQYQISIKQVF